MVMHLYITSIRNTSTCSRENMPSLVRKCSISAAVDGLILQPLTQRNQRSSQSVQISYGTCEITSKNTSQEDQSDAAETLEIQGVVGRLPSQRFVVLC